MNNTFKKYSKNISDFFDLILATSPDYIVPVERKGCKLIRSLKDDDKTNSYNIRYKQYFSNTKPNIKGKKIAIIDDASKYTSTLYEYRKYFEEQGAIVDTYSFVGQDLLRTAEREQYDEKAKIFQYLKESTYQEYIIQQSIELSKDDHSFDIDHLVFRTELSENLFSDLIKNLSELGELQYTNDVYTPKNITKLCLYNFRFPIQFPFVSDDLVYNSNLSKIRIAYNLETKCLSIVPLYFVSWNISSASNIKNTLGNLPFELPYELNANIENEGIYMNILYSCNLYLLKAFFSQMPELVKNQIYTIDDFDLISYVGNEKAVTLKKSTILFLQSTINSSLNNLLNPIPAPDVPKFYSIMNIMKTLRSEYERRIEQNNSVLGTKFFLSFDELIARYEGRANLIKWIDILCDRGVLVARNVLINGVYCRACRSGEGDYDHIEKKASILLPIIINICGTREENSKLHRMEATFLNKVLANLAYDYPMDRYDFHNFFTKPYLYGPFSYAKNRLNEEIETALYDVNKISKYCIRDKNGDFLSINQEIIPNEIDAFSQSDSVPLSEITSYIDCLNTIHEKFGKADSLNQLIICRDQDIYYRHVHYDIVLAHSNILTAYRTFIPSKAERYLRDAAKVANASLRKLKYNQKELFDTIEKFVGYDVRFRDAYKKIIDSVVPFSDEFNTELSKLSYTTFLEQAIINIMLYKLVLDKKYLSKFIIISDKNKFIDIDILEKLKVLCTTEAQEEYSNLYKSTVDLIDSTIQKLCEKLCICIHSLKKPTDTNYVRANKRRDIDVAINKCIQYIKNTRISNYVILHFDFFGYRNTQNAKNINVVEEVQKIVNSILKLDEDNIYIYGEVGTNSFGTILFKNLEKAICFAEKLRTLFSEPDYEQVGFKFGCAFGQVSDTLHSDIKSVWNQASTACNVSKRQCSYSAGFVIVEDMYENIKCEEKNDFMKININEDSYYIHNDFEEIDSQKTIQYKEEVDKSVGIGIITALPEEFAAMKNMMINPRTAVFPKTSMATGREYCIGKIRSLDGREHKVALAQTIGPGNTSAAIRANCLRNRFPNIDVIIMVGIAGGIPSPEDKEKHVRLGDIVIAKEIVSYDFVSERAEIEELRGCSVPPAARLLEAQAHLDVGKLMGEKPWEKYIDEICQKYPETFARPSNETDILYDIQGNSISHPEDPNRNDYPYIFKEKIASANRVLKNPSKRDDLKKTYSVHAVEMEGSGIAEATWQLEIGYYVVRGISDYCDGKKNDIWHNYAALVAAAYTRSLIEKLPY